MDIPHTPVLQKEVLQLFQSSKLEIFVDGTLGAGGHAHSLLTAHPEIVRYIGIDQDPTAQEIARERLIPFSDKLTICCGNFSQLNTLLNRENVEKVDGILLDIGVSSMQLDMAEKGFSFMQEGPLDMRMDPQNPLTAQEIISHWSEEELAQIFSQFGEVPNSRTIARIIASYPHREEIQTTRQLANLIEPHLKRRRNQKVHPLTLVFQALRIAVNNELHALEDVLPQAINRLNPNGILAIISFHGLEDRIVKQCFAHESKDWEEDPTDPYTGRKPKKARAKLLTRKAISPTHAETKANPRSRSAKLRAIVRLP